MELNTMSVHALSERVENLEQQLAAANQEFERFNGVFAQDGVDICEPVEGFANRPRDLLRCVQELIVKMVEAKAGEAFWRGSTYTHDLNEQRLAAELQRVRSDRNKLASAATMVVSNWDIFEIQDTTARQVFGSSIGWLRAALATPAAEPDSDEELVRYITAKPAPATELNGTISALIECCRKICFPMVSAESHKVVKELQAALNRLDQPAPATEQEG